MRQDDDERADLLQGTSGDTTVRDITVSWSLDHRRKRVLIAASGSVLAMLALFAVVSWPNHGKQHKALRTATPANVIGAAARYEGHHIISPHNSLCLDWLDTIIHTYPCNPGCKTQKWVISRGVLRHVRTMQNLCLDDGGQNVHVWNCDDKAPMQEWNFDMAHGTIHNGTNFCLRANPQYGVVSMVTCNPGDPFQVWKVTLPKDLPTSSKVPATEAPVTQAPTTEAATTQAPTSEATATQVPTTEAPVTEAPATVAPATIVAPVTEAPQPVEEEDESGDEGDSEGEEDREKEETPGSTNSVRGMAAPIKHSLGNCLDGGGHEVHLWQCTTSSDNQRWTYDPAKGTIKTAKGECLDASTKNFKKACKGDVNQMWSLDASSGKIKSASGQCLHAHDPRTAGSIVALEDCNADDSKESWILGPLEVAHSSTVNYIIACCASLTLLVLVFAMIYMYHRQKPTKVQPTPAPSAAMWNPETPSQEMLIPEMPIPANPAPVLQPKLDAITFIDPRFSAGGPREIGIVAFSHGSHPEPCDDLCQSGFLGNCYDLGEGGLAMVAMGTERKFSNAEAAFRALQFWAQSDEFMQLDGFQAMAKKQDLRGLESNDYAGFGNQWNAMFSVLQRKFESGTALGRALEATGDAFLLFHSASKGSLAAFPDSRVWSDGCDGEGSNLLGMQLMLLRERRTGWKRWTSLIEQSIETSSGESRVPDDGAVRVAVLWQDVVRRAAAAAADRSPTQSSRRTSEAPLLGTA